MSLGTIKIKINCSRITKARLFKGERGTYLNCIAIPLKKPDQFGQTHMIVEDVSKEERDQGIKGAIIGNAKLMPPRDGGGPAPAPGQASTPSAPRERNTRRW